MKSGSVSLYSLNLPQSVRSETKDQFDAILNVALGKNLVDSKDKVECSVSNKYEDIIVDKNDYDEEKESKRFILSKFLDDTTALETSTGIAKTTKRPVPKPRKKVGERRDSDCSTGTFYVTSSKVSAHIKEANNGNNKETTRRDSNSSIGTFSVTSPKVLFNNPSQIGEVVLHNSPVDSKIVVTKQNDTLEGSNDKISSKSSSSKNIEIQVVSGLTINKEEIFDDSFSMEHCEKNNTLTLNKVSFDYETITEIIIHKTDNLLLNSFVIHPVVKIHVIDIRTGNYFKKSNKNRPVTFYYENEHNDFILPVMTNYYNLQENRSFCPMWEETVLLNEDFKYFVNENVIIFFEIMDFLTKNFSTLKKDKGKFVICFYLYLFYIFNCMEVFFYLCCKLVKIYFFFDNIILILECQKGWYKIAFSFLKVIGKNGARNVNKKVRLQLYYHDNSNVNKTKYNHCELWDLWQNKKLKKYPSTLHITIKEVVSPKMVIKAFRSKTPLQKEELLDKTNNESEVFNEDQIHKDADNLKLKLNKILKKEEILPNECVCQLGPFEDGCFVLKFSHHGMYLACGVRIEDDFQIIIYLVQNFEEKFKFKSHQALIHCISWSLDDKYLLSASSDNTVAIWNVQKNLFLQILPHPSFVYTCNINFENIVATGCYDEIIRIWSFNSDTYKFELNQELEKHKGYIISLCFSRKTANLLYSADSCGQICEWVKKEDWELMRTLDILDLRETKINQILLFPNEKKMLVHSRDSALRVISVENVCVIHWLHGALNIRFQTFCDISPDGLLVAAGGENGLVVLWDTKTGKPVKTFEAFSKMSKVTHCVQFHTKFNILAISHYGSNEPVLIYGGSTKNRIDNVDLNVQNVNSKIIRDQSGMNKIEKFDFRAVLRKIDKLLD